MVMLKSFLTLALLSCVSTVPVEKRAVGIGPASAAEYADFIRFVKYCGATLASTCPHPGGDGHTYVATIHDDGTNTNGYVARDDERLEIVVAFKGSSNPNNFLTDATVALIQCASPGVAYPTGALCHTGFQEAYNSVAAQVLSTVRAQLAAHPKYTIRVTGHSLGGALASVAGVSMRNNFPNNLVYGVTFGQPRTGDYNYAQYVDKLFPFRFGRPTFMRAIHTNDGVPGMPRAGSDGTMVNSAIGTTVPNNNVDAKSGYRHHGTEFWQNPDPATRQVTAQCRGQEDTTCALSIAPTNVAPAFGIDLAHLTYFNTYLADPNTAQANFCT